MGNLFLTSVELIELTGLRRPKAQVKWLRKNAIDHLVRADGLVVVLRSTVEARMGPCPSARTAEQTQEPNWNTVDGPQA